MKAVNIQFINNNNNNNNNNNENETMKKQLEFIRSLPKTDLHCHIDGSVRPETIRELIINEGEYSQFIEMDDFKQNVQVTTRDGDLIEYLKKFELPLKIFEKPENIKRVTKELLEDVSKQGVSYVELRFAPFFCKDESKAEERVRAALDGLREGSKEFNVRGNLILCAMRHEKAEKTFEVVKLALKYKNKGVVAVDLAGNEQDFPPNIHKNPFFLAHEAGLKITIHAGETGRHWNIIDSIKNLKADRIGHGVSAINEDKVIKYLVDRKIPLELCIKSNIDTNAVKSLREHPIYKLFKKGVKITLNTDNMTVSDVTIMDEYKRLLLLGFSMKEVSKVIRNGIEASFTPTKVKVNMLREFDSKVKKYYSTLDNKILSKSPSMSEKVI